MSMNWNLDLSELSVEDIGAWPGVVKGLVIFFICASIFGIGIWFESTTQMVELEAEKQSERDLRVEFVTKHGQTANIEAYKQQIASMNETLGTMLHQLPSQTEVPGLLEDISETGIAKGLEFKLFKPEPEVQHDFYAELPIKIVVKGTYHQLAEFISSVADLERIVTINDFKIEHPRKKNNQRAANKKPAADDELVMDLTAKTYRYTNEKEKA